ALGDPTLFAVTLLRSPDRFIYLGENVDLWKIKHTHGRFHGWTAQITRAAPPFVLMQSWNRGAASRMRAWLHRHYQSTYLGRYHLFVTPAAQARARQLGVTLTPT